MSDTESDIVESSDDHSARGFARAHYALEEWAVRRTLACVDREATGLTREPATHNIADHITWGALLTFSMDQLQRTLVATAPVIRTLVTTAAISPWRRKESKKQRVDDLNTYEDRNGPEREGHSSKGHTPRVPWLVSKVS